MATSAETDAKEISAQETPANTHQHEVVVPSAEETVNTDAKETGAQETPTDEKTKEIATFQLPESDDSYKKQLEILNASFRRNQRRVAAFNLVSALPPAAITVWQTLTDNHWLAYCCGWVSFVFTFNAIPIFECEKRTTSSSIAVGGILLTLITTAFYVLTLAAELPFTETDLLEQIGFGFQILLHFIALFASAVFNRRFARDLTALETSFNGAVLELHVDDEEVAISI